MANKNPLPPPASTRWKKGQSGNISGKPKNVFTAEELRKKIAKTVAMTKEQLAEVLQDKKSTVIELVLASVAAKAIKDGDINKMEYLFNRSLGKVKEVIETIDSEREAIKKMSTEELKAFIQNEEGKNEA